MRSVIACTGVGGCIHFDYFRVVCLLPGSYNCFLLDKAQPDELRSAGGGSGDAGRGDAGRGDAETTRGMTTGEMTPGEVMKVLMEITGDHDESDPMVCRVNIQYVCIDIFARSRLHK